MQPVFRFAPSPNGRLHRGHAFSALLNRELACAWGGRFLLRIEDIDVTRCRPEYENAILEDLSWLGLSWEHPVRRQSEHFDDYRDASSRLRASGLLYPCFCSRGDIMRAATALAAKTGAPPARDPDGALLYPGTCRHLEPNEARRRIEAGEPHAWRLAMDEALRLVPGPHFYRRFHPSGAAQEVLAAPWLWGDAVIVRKEVPASYHLAVVHDDALQGVSHVVRGRDLEAATDLHVLLQALLGLPTPLYHHHALLLDTGGAKLAKSLASTPLADLRAGGLSAELLRRELGFPLGHGAPAI